MEEKSDIGNGGERTNIYYAPTVFLYFTFIVLIILITTPETGHHGSHLAKE